MAKLHKQFEDILKDKVGLGRVDSEFASDEEASDFGHIGSAARNGCVLSCLEALKRQHTCAW